MELPVDTDKTGDLPAFPPMHVSHAPASCRALWAPTKRREEEKQKWKVCAGYSLTIDRSSLAHLSATAIVAVPRWMSDVSMSASSNLGMRCEWMQRLRNVPPGNPPCIL